MMLKPCQLEAMSRELARGDELARELTGGEKVARRWSKISRRVRQLLPKLLSPRRMARKLRTISLPQIGVGSGDSRIVALRTAPIKLPPLGLKVGEKVRVKTFEQVQQTLDEQERYEGCTFTSAMTQYCGKEYIVRKPIGLFFDERTWKLLKAKNLVILEGVYCSSPANSFQHWAGCDRSCFLFWKEAWLERVEPAVE